MKATTTSQRTVTARAANAALADSRCWLTPAGHCAFDSYGVPVNFYGRAYWYPTPNHGACPVGVLGCEGDTWLIVWIAPPFGTPCRMLSHHLSGSHIQAPKAAQAKLDVWAKARGLTPVRAAERSEASHPTVKVLTVKMPWAWLIVAGWKPVENRDWSTTYRGQLQIHASQSCTFADFMAACLFMQGDPRIPWPAIRKAMLNANIRPGSRCPGLGQIIGQVDLVDVVTVSRSPWFTGTHGLVIANPRPLSPVYATGRLGLWNYTPNQ
jgi:hypothetical protein